MNALQRRQLDAQLGPTSLLRQTSRPSDGWVTTIRQALGMSLRQLAARMSITPQAVAELEKAERRDSITVGKLRQVADALECDLVVAFVPRRSLEAMVADRAEAKAARARARVTQTMQLEAQDAGAASGLDETLAGETPRSIPAMSRTFWDD